MTLSCAYVRHNYGVPAEVGRAVTVDGKPGVIAADRGHHIGVNFDEDEPGVIRNCHPTWRVVYGDLRPVRQLPRAKARAKARYQHYLDVGECYESFRHFIIANYGRGGMPA